MPKLASETIGINLFNFDTERRCAFITMKNGFIISDGCNEKKPRLIHLCEPFMDVPTKNTKQSKHKQNKYPRHEKLSIDAVDNIEQNSIITTPNKQKII